MIHLHVTQLKSQGDEELQSGILGPLLAYIQSLRAGQQTRHQALVKEPVIMQPILWATADYMEPESISTEQQMKYLFSIGDSSYSIYLFEEQARVDRVWHGPGSLHIAEFMHTAWETGAETVAFRSPAASMQITVKGFDYGAFPYIYIEATKSQRPARACVTPEMLKGSTYIEDRSGGYQLIPEPEPGWPHKPWPIGAAILDIGLDWTKGLKRRVRLVNWPDGGARPQ